ncbi:Deoxyguanosinetriphosphate triphosphohydrolase [uncultured Paludibacter sp.]|uniref:Deoxyguanosinetriphosphate triphosphohydrolase n=1 Tax=uncultured Paludibacter sp. TaxID=497635 RepID=A0A653AGT5_9BACT|nr:Deoxyguanosinetriphosphate triphosphohydrolase [uncultured Paludibacter sp.]
MNWNQLLSPLRLGMETYQDHYRDYRNEFQRDYDRLIFSAPFRRLQNKTQVFPLPGSIFVHNRLTHSLEVSSVGRSLGTIVSRELIKKNPNESDFLSEIGSVVAAACLAHDLGNPPFGHSGEEAIATFFSEGKGHFLKEKMNDVEWKDCTIFEGNANAFRLLTHQFNGRRKGGFVLTYSTLASIVKYPYSSIYADTNKQKFGFFESEKTDFEKIAGELGIPKRKDNPNRFVRYPLVYLVEAADDICYQLMDIEDAHKLRLLTTDETKELMFGFFNDEKKKRREYTLTLVSDTNEQIAYLRSSVIGQLIKECSDVFLANEKSILDGTFEGSLIKQISPISSKAYKTCSEVAVNKIYKSQEVLDIELAGYKIILTLLEHFIEAVLNPQKSYSKQLLNRIPSQYEIRSKTVYGKVQAILDYISGMTDIYALDLYRKIMGMEV